MKLKNISIENYRFFKEKQEFNFTSKENIPQNILLYGENGSGKTSLYNALKDFFFYYKNPSEAKNKIKENKNIFSLIADKPKIEITFEDDISISFTETGFDKDDLKDKIERVSISKLFLTYKDIYTLNNIFKKDISYKEFKEIFNTLYFDELDDSFENFDKNFDELQDIILNYTHDMKKDYVYLEQMINDFNEQFTYELEPILKKDPVDKDKYLDFIYDTVFYISEEYIDKLTQSKKILDTFWQICSNDKVFRADYYDLQSKFIDIIKKVVSYTRKSDRYEADEFSERIIIIDREELESNSELDRIIREIEIYADDTAYKYLECEKYSQYINEKIFEKLISSKDRINNILSFLGINIKLEEIKAKPFLYFDTNYIFTEYIRNIDFKILLSNVELRNHWSNLNEAKLSALNLAIYLSSVLGKKPDIPILVLDDLLISLDMNNRDKVLSLLLDRTLNQEGQTNFFDDEYQMFIFTHDRAFFEL
ncbi:MAG: ATP-binding protein, partial [Arcobacteraceae bacterium]|nr:ATP-binding protein [Arcobacteraceae bacterium]